PPAAVRLVSGSPSCPGRQGGQQQPQSDRETMQSARVSPALEPESARLGKSSNDQGGPLWAEPSPIAIIVRFGRRVSARSITTTVDRDRRNTEAHREVRVGARRRRRRGESECLACVDCRLDNEHAVGLRAGGSYADRVDLDA